MEGQVIVTTPQQLKLLVVEAVSIAFKYYQPTPTSAKIAKGEYIDFAGMADEYYPGIPASTVRQDTAPLSRLKVGKRVLFNRTEVEEHLQKKRRGSSEEIEQLIHSQFADKQQRRGGRKAA